MRHMHPSDVARVEHLARVQNRRDGTSYPVPQVFDESGKQIDNAPLALVVTNDENEIVQAHVFQRTIEMCSFGGSQESLEFSLETIDQVCYLLSRKGYTDMHVQVPLQKHRKLSPLGKVIQKALAKIGFTRDDHRMAHNYRELKVRSYVAQPTE